MKTVGIIVSGKVQGVFYRQSTKREADKLGLKGTVQNKNDGSVYIEILGDTDKVDKLVKWCHNGPSQATVVNVEIIEITPKEFDSFKIVK